MDVDEKGVKCAVVSLSGTIPQHTFSIIPVSGDTPMYIWTVHQAFAQLDTDRQLAHQGQAYWTRAWD